MALSRQQKITTIVLVFYWPALFVLAHVPIPQLVRRAGVSDKSLHFLAYLILAFLLWFAVSGDKKVCWRRAAPWWVLLIIVAYGILDEWLQGCVVGRSCDVRDFFADLAGTVTGLILFSVFSFWPGGLLVTATVIFGVTNIARANLADLLPVTNAIFHFFAYAIFTMLWVQYMRLFLPKKEAPSIEWLVAALTAPTVLLFTVKLFSVILGKAFVVRDMLISVGAIVAVVATIYLTALFRKKEDTRHKT